MQRYANFLRMGPLEAQTLVGRFTICGQYNDLMSQEAMSWLGPRSELEVVDWTDCCCGMLRFELAECGMFWRWRWRR
jgi:hypothetical protein